MIKKGKHIPIDSLEISLIDRFESMVKLFPEKTAVIDGEEKISYQELDKKANQLANKIKLSGIHQNSMHYSLSMVWHR